VNFVASIPIPRPEVRPGTLPTAVHSWTVRTGYDEWMLQAVTVEGPGQNGYGTPAPAPAAQ